MVDFNCCPHMAELRTVLENSQADCIRLQIEVKKLKSDNELLMTQLQEQEFQNVNSTHQA